MDADGDLDIVANTDDRHFWFYENTGTSSAASFVLRTAKPEPIAGLPMSDFWGFALGDIDSDGDLDLVTARRAGQFLLKRNPTGDPLPPPISAWEATSSANPFAGLDVGTHATPSFGDWDGDGDPDLVAGFRLGLIGELYGSENTGNARNPRFASLVSMVDAHLEQWVTAPALGDLDHDGDLDVVSGEPDGRFFYSRNDGDAKPSCP
ncbi:MAG: VCBS repeat-containing protein [Deltaproteobacteria bacterium]|nr:VCBS repeat-containing protein [Deltaproteobacteria bacterium]